MKAKITVSKPLPEGLKRSFDFEAGTFIKDVRNTSGPGVFLKVKGGFLGLETLAYNRDDSVGDNYAFLEVPNCSVTISSGDADDADSGAEGKANRGYSGSPTGC